MMRLFNGSKKVKQCLILFTAAYVAFTALFADPDGGMFVGVSRSLQEGEYATDVDRHVPGSSDHGSSDGSSSSDIDSADEIENTEILVIIMGESSTFPSWIDTLGSIEGSSSISLLFGSFDEKIPHDACENDYDLPCQVAYIPGTTWTEGRNLLAGEAARKEVRRGEKYDYWMFLDDDVAGDCGDEDGLEIKRTLGEGSCWQKIFNYISSDDVPENASTVTLPRREGFKGFSGFSSTDAMFAAFKRDKVPYMLPYVTLKEGSSQWTSQASLFCIMRTCLRSSAVFVPYVAGLNPIHHEYARGKKVEEIRETIANNYHDEKAGFFPCEDYNAGHIEPYQNPTGVFATSAELNEHIPPTEEELCEPMKERFERWKHEQLVLPRLE